MIEPMDKVLVFSHYGGSVFGKDISVLQYEKG